MSPWLVRDRLLLPNVRYHLLVVEPNDLMRKVITDAFLPWEQFVVEVATTGREAIGQGSSQRFDLTLLALPLPDLDGLAVARALRQRHPLRIIGLSAKAAPDARACRDAGIADVLIKPFSALELLEHVSDHLGLSPPTPDGPGPSKP